MAFKMKKMSFGKGPVKRKSMMEAKKKPYKKPSVHPDSDRHISAVPTFSDHIEEAKVRRKNKKK